MSASAPIRGGAVELRGVRAWLTIADHEGIPDQYVTVGVYVEGDRIASSTAQGEECGPLYSADLRALPPGVGTSAPPTATDPLTRAELGVLLEALDSHVYWQLSDPVYRDSGYVQPPGSDDENDAEAIADCAKLDARLRALHAAAPVVHAIDCDLDGDCTCGAVAS